MRKQRFIRGPELLDSGRVDTYKTYKGQYPEVLVGIVHVVEVV